MKLKFLKCCLLALVAVVPAKAADVSSAVTNQLTLDGLVNEVLEKNPELNFYRAEIVVAKGGRKSAGAWSDPEVSGTIAQKRVEAGGFSDEGKAWSVSVNQTFEFPGRLSLRKAIANRDIQLAELGFAQFRQALAAHVRTLGYNIYIAQEKLAASSEVAARFQALTDVLVQRDSAGVTPLLETRIIEASALTLQREASEATIAAQTALMELNQLRGQSPDSAVRVEKAELRFSRSPSQDSLLEAARTNAFELRMRQVELEQQGFKVSLAKNERYPGVKAGPFYSEEKAGDKETMVGLGVSLPLPLWNRNSGNIDTAKAREQQAEMSLLITRRAVERRVMEASTTLNVKLAEMSMWRTDAVEKFREAAELADRHYRMGAVPISTYMELQKQYLEAVGAILSTKKEALEAAQTLEQLTGHGSLVEVKPPGEVK